MSQLTLNCEKEIDLPMLINLFKTCNMFLKEYVKIGITKKMYDCEPRKEKELNMSTMSTMSNKRNYNDMYMDMDQCESDCDSNKLSDLSDSDCSSNDSGYHCDSDSWYDTDDDKKNKKQRRH